MAKKGGKRSGGGGGGKTRKYSRDNNGRFASTGTGATARGGRLKTASGNKRATQTTKAAAAKPSGTVAGKVKRNPAAAGKIGQAKAAAKPPRFSAEDSASRKSRAGQLKAMPKDLRRADRTARIAQREVMATNGAVGGNVIGRNRSSTQSKINSIREGLMRAKGDKTGSIRSQVLKEAKQLRARMQTTAAGPRTGAQSGIKRQTVTAAKLKGTVAKRAARTAAKPAAPKAAKRKAIGAISEAKAGRIISRIDANRPGLRKATGSARKTQNSIRTQRKATDFALAAGARARKQGKSLSVNESLQRGVKNAAAKSRKSPKAATPAATSKPTRASRTQNTGQQIVNANIRKVQNQKLRTLNAKIKEAGPNAAGLRLQKLQLQSNMTSTRPKRTPKQEAKEQASVAAAKERVATMRRVNRARANKDRTADTRNTPGSAMKRRPSQKTTRANNLADRALSFYSNPTKALQAVRKNKPGFRLPRSMR